MFSIVAEDFHGTEKIKLLNPQSGEYLSLLPAYGGNINELVFYKNNQRHSILSGDHNTDQLSGKTPNTYRGAKLSPFPNRINKGTYTFQGVNHVLPINDPPHALHGLLWNKPFVIKEKETTAQYAKLIVGTRYTPTESGYPFEYEIEIEYRLEAKQLSCKTTVTNHSPTAIPLGDGWHPYFTTGTPIDRLAIQLPTAKKIATDETLIPTGEYFIDKTFERPALIGDTFLDDCFELPPVERTVETVLLDREKNLTLVLWQQTGVQGYNFVHLYTPPDRRSIAIEPTTCAPDAFNNHNGLIILDALETVDFLFGIRLE